MARRLLTQEEYIEKAKSIHGDKYDYSEINYINSTTNIKVKCDNGHTFLTNPSNHISSNKTGCPHCSSKKASTTEEYILSAIKVHGNKYDYSLVDYKNSRTKIEVICDQGHIFKVQPNNHISSNKTGCPHCSPKRAYTTEEFITMSNKIHNNQYDYSETVYIDSRTKVKIKCSHGHTFEVTPANHTLRKTGCPTCSNGKQIGMMPTFFKGKPSTLYYAKIGEVYKIGVTTRTPQQRLYGQTKGKKYTILKEWHYKEGYDAYLQEQAYLEQFKEFKYNTTNNFMHGGINELFFKDVLNLDLSNS